MTRTASLLSSQRPQSSSTALVGLALLVGWLTVAVQGAIDITGLELFNAATGDKIQDLECNRAYTLCRSELGHDFSIQANMAAAGGSTSRALRWRYHLQDTYWASWTAERTEHVDGLDDTVYYTQNDLLVPLPFMQTDRQVKFQAQGCAFDNCTNPDTGDDPPFGNFCTIDFDIVSGDEPDECDICEYVKLDFNDRTKGEYITTQLEEDYHVLITASGSGGPNDLAFTPGGAARIFDSSDPGIQSAGDPDLGSPHNKCDVGGPGYGQGGKPGSDYENCYPPWQALDCPRRQHYRSR